MSLALGLPGPAFALRPVGLEESSERRSLELALLNPNVPARNSPLAPSARFQPPVSVPSAGLEERWGPGPSIPLSTEPGYDRKLFLYHFNPALDTLSIEFLDEDSTPSKSRLAFQVQNARGQKVQENVVILRRGPLFQLLKGALAPELLEEIWPHERFRPNLRSARVREILMSPQVRQALAESKAQAAKKSPSAKYDKGLVLSFQEGEIVVLFNTAGDNQEEWVPIAEVEVQPERSDLTILRFTASQRVGITRQSYYEGRVKPGFAGLEEGLTHQQAADLIVDLFTEVKTVVFPAPVSQSYRRKNLTKPQIIGLLERVTRGRVILGVSGSSMTVSKAPSISPNSNGGLEERINPQKGLEKLELADPFGSYSNSQRPQILKRLAEIKASHPEINAVGFYLPGSRSFGNKKETFWVSLDSFGGNLEKAVDSILNFLESKGAGRFGLRLGEYSAPPVSGKMLLINSFHAAGLEEPPYMTSVPDDYAGPVAIVGKGGGTTVRFQAAVPQGLAEGTDVTGPTVLHPGVDTQDQILDRIVDQIAQVVDQFGPNRVMYVHLSFPGYFDEEMRLTRDQENIPGMKAGLHLASALQDRLAAKYPRPPALGPIQVVVVHDGTGGANGERSAFGKYPGATNIFFLAPGTGIATRAILNGKAFTGGPQVQSLANEAPHTLVFNGDPEHPDYRLVILETKGDHPDFDHVTLPSGQPNPLYKAEDMEDRTSGPAIARYARELAKSGQFDLDTVSELRLISPDHDLEKITTKELGLAASWGNPLALKAVQDRARELGIGLAVLLVEFHKIWPEFSYPPHIVVGGGVAQIGDLYLNALREGFRNRLTRYAAEEQGLGLPDINEFVSRVEPSAITDDSARELLAGLPTQTQSAEHAAKLKNLSGGLEELLTAEQAFEKINDWSVGSKEAVRVHFFGGTKVNGKTLDYSGGRSGTDTLRAYLSDIAGQSSLKILKYEVTQYGKPRIVEIRALTGLEEPQTAAVKSTLEKFNRVRGLGERQVPIQVISRSVLSTYDPSERESLEVLSRLTAGKVVLMREGESGVVPADRFDSQTAVKKGAVFYGPPSEFENFARQARTSSFTAQHVSSAPPLEFGSLSTAVFGNFAGSYSVPNEMEQIRQDLDYLVELAPPALGKYLEESGQPQESRLRYGLLPLVGLKTAKAKEALSSPQVRLALRVYLSEKDRSYEIPLRKAAVEAVGLAGHPEDLPFLLSIIQDKSDTRELDAVRVQAAKALPNIHFATRSQVERALQAVDALAKQNENPLPVRGLRAQYESDSFSWAPRFAFRRDLIQARADLVALQDKVGLEEGIQRLVVVGNDQAAIEQLRGALHSLRSTLQIVVVKLPEESGKVAGLFADSTQAPEAAIVAGTVSLMTVPEIRRAVDQLEANGALVRFIGKLNAEAIDEILTELDQDTAGLEEPKALPKADPWMPWRLLHDQDPEIYNILLAEYDRQHGDLDLIASETYTDPLVLAAMSLAGALAMKYGEGNPPPKKRFYPGMKKTFDPLELKAQVRLLDAFEPIFPAIHARYGANVQSVTGSTANEAVYFSVLNPGDTIMSLDLVDGGHLSHGFKLNISGKVFNVLKLKVIPESGEIDYTAVRKYLLEELKPEQRPRLLIVGGTAYTRQLNFEELRSIADAVTDDNRAKGHDAPMLLVADVSHNLAQILVEKYNSPFPHAHFITSTTHKSTGPRSAFILSSTEAIEAVNTHVGLKGKRAKTTTLADLLDRAIIPGLLGGPKFEDIAAKAVLFRVFLQPRFQEYARQIGQNTKALAAALKDHVKIVGGDETHLLLIDSRERYGLTGAQVQEALERVDILANSNLVSVNPEAEVLLPEPLRQTGTNPAGNRIGVPAPTFRGMKGPQMQVIAGLIIETLENTDPATGQPKNLEIEADIKRRVRELTDAFPVLEAWRALFHAVGLEEPQEVTEARAAVSTAEKMAASAIREGDQNLEAIARIAQIDAENRLGRLTATPVNPDVIHVSTGLEETSVAQNRVFPQGEAVERRATVPAVTFEWATPWMNQLGSLGVTAYDGLVRIPNGKAVTPDGRPDGEAGKVGLARAELMPLLDSDSRVLEVPKVRVAQANLPSVMTVWVQPGIILPSDLTEGVVVRTLPLEMSEEALAQLGQSHPEELVFLNGDQVGLESQGRWASELASRGLFGLWVSPRSATFLGLTRDDLVTIRVILKSTGGSLYVLDIRADKDSVFVYLRSA